MLKNSVITKSYLENVRHPLSSSHLKTQSEVLKLFFRERNKLTPIIQSKDLFM